MPPRGVKKGTKRARQYSKIKQSARKRGASASRAKEMAARTVNKNRSRSKTNSSKGQTKEQLYSRAKRLRIAGRSSMNKSQLQRAVAAKKR
jgi:hypothetical protein